MPSPELHQEVNVCAQHWGAGAMAALWSQPALCCLLGTARSIGHGLCAGATPACVGPCMSPVSAEHLGPPSSSHAPSPCPAECSCSVAPFGGRFLGELLHRVGRWGLQSTQQSYVLHAVVLHAVLLHPSRLSPMQADELSNPFGQISLSRQGSTEAPDPSSAMFQSSLISQHPQQTGFIMATPGQPISTSNYSASGHTAPTQQVLQPQGYIQPPQQVRTCASLEGLRPSAQSRQARGCRGAQRTVP